jgi:hypothetical protein
MSNCKHAYYQSAKCQGDWLCEHCGSVISTWQRLNLAFIERDKLRVENTELRELCDKADIIMERMAEEAQEDDRIRTLAQAVVFRHCSWRKTQN